LKGLILNEKNPQEYAALKIPECWQVDPIKNQVTAEQVLSAEKTSNNSAIPS